MKPQSIRLEVKKRSALVSEAQKWSYRDVEITVGKYAQFEACVNGKHISAGSFDTIKKKIDDLASFDGFAAYVSKYAAFRTVKIVGIVKSSYGRSFVDDKGEEHERVLRDIPKNRAAVEALVAARAEEEARRGAADLRMRKLNEAIKWERVEK